VRCEEDDVRRRDRCRGISGQTTVAEILVEDRSPGEWHAGRGEIATEVILEERW
jgi:hypothetical protein